MEGAQAPAIKDALRKRVEDAVALGVFGAPTIVVDGEMFWGNDRLPQIERWLATRTVLGPVDAWLAHAPVLREA